MQTVLYYKRLYLHNQLSGERNMSDIATIIIFKKENGEEFIFDDKYVQLTSLENKMMIFRFEAPQDILKEGAEFFGNFKTYEHIKVDIGGTGDRHIQAQRQGICIRFDDDSALSVSLLVGKVPQEERWR